jgi:mannitol-1-/sugar-/sorbitol-6-/2-deoxyglucose-6-phosphatase
MKSSAVIFDMDGLLINSEPLWGEAADEILGEYGVALSKTQYAQTTGLRTREFLGWWFKHFDIDQATLHLAETAIIEKVTQKIIHKGAALPGVEYIFRFFAERNFVMGLATSSPKSLAETVIAKLSIGNYLQAVNSAEHLPYGKPHPQVYLDCAAALNVLPYQCICFEDSFNGMIAAKAARMKCVVIPSREEHASARWQAADLKLSSLLNFNQLILDSF